MDKLLSRKINLLVHLAKVDGKFDHSERALLVSILKEKGLEESYLEVYPNEPVDMNTVQDWLGKTELFFWILRLIKADNYLHPNELAYAKALALKLNFKPEAVDFYCNNEIPDISEFEAEMDRFRMKNISSIH